MSIAKRKRRSRKRALTLVEVLVVITLIALVSGGVALAVFKHAEKARIRTAETEATIIRQAVRTWRELEGNPGCPTVQQLLAAELLEATARGVDPCGRTYGVRCTDEGVTVSSSGPDRRDGTEDDIRARAPKRSE
jgi:general secretion pathway protein G